jgi:hypothetical protein
VEAVLFQRDCGATTGFTTQVAIVSKGTDVSAADAIFVADGDHGAASAAEWGGPWAEIEWPSAERLIIRYDRAARVFRATQQAGVTVDFLPSPPPS